MIFEAIYSIYFRTMDKLLALAIKEELNEETFRKIINDNSYDESIHLIEKAVLNNEWNLITKDFYTPVNNVPSEEVTLLQKRFLKTISSDPRFKLFSDIKYSDDISPLYDINDIIYFDRFNTSDNFTDENYIKHFRMIMEIIKEEKSCKVAFVTGRGKRREVFMIPQKIEYSKKDDKFRILSNKYIVNFSSIVNIEKLEKDRTRKHYIKKETVEVIIYDKRGAFERVMIAFSGYKKETMLIEEDTYKMILTYHSDDITELLIRLLSFGPMIKVVSPDSFVELIVERLNNQKRLQQ